MAGETSRATAAGNSPPTSAANALREAFGALRGGGNRDSSSDDDADEEDDLESVFGRPRGDTNQMPPRHATGQNSAAGESDFSDPFGGGGANVLSLHRRQARDENRQTACSLQ